MRTPSETVIIQSSSFDFTAQNNEDKISSINTISSVNTPSPYVDNENIQRKRRKRQANSQLWRRNITKLLRNSGQAYSSMSKTKKKIAEKKMGVVCSEKCKLQCYTKFTNQERLYIFSQSKTNARTVLLLIILRIKLHYKTITKNIYWKSLFQEQKRIKTKKMQAIILKWQYTIYRQ